MTACGSCRHLITAHTVPDGRCLLCDACAGWTEEAVIPADQVTVELRHRFVVDVLRSTRYPGCPDEYALQAAAAARLVATGAPVDREVVLSDRDRPDLIAGGVCVECKVAGSAGNVLAQLTRYAEHDRVESLVLLTRKATHRDLPEQVLGKQLSVVFTAAAL